MSKMFKGAKNAVMVEIAALFCYNFIEERSAAEWRALLDKKEDEIVFLHRQID